MDNWDSFLERSQDQMGGCKTSGNLSKVMEVASLQDVCFVLPNSWALGPSHRAHGGTKWRRWESVHGEARQGVS